MAELYNNDASTSLAASIGASDTTLTVVSSQEFNTSPGQFRIRIDDELMIVTSVSGNIWTVTRAAEACEGAQVAAVHAVNSAVYGVLTVGSLLALSGAGSGTVTSVGLSVPTGFTVSGSPVTSSGTLALGLSNEPANTVWAGPASGGPATPTFRSLVLADMPAGVGAIVIGAPVGSAIPYEIFCANSTGGLAQDAILRYQNGFTILTDNGQPLLAQINDTDFSFGFIAAVP